MLLWNWLMPAIFHLPNITYWQAWGLVILSHILFKAGGGNHQRYKQGRWKKRMKEKLHRHLQEKRSDKSETVGNTDE